MSEAQATLAEVRGVLDELVALLTRHRLFDALPGVRNLRADAEDVPDEAPERTLARLRRAYWQLITIPGGLADAYVQDGGDVDREATRHLDELRDRLTALLPSNEEFA